jgi:hypothetical protein
MNEAMRRFDALVGEWDVTIVMRAQPGRIDVRADASEDAGQTWRNDLDYIFERRPRA